MHHRFILSDDHAKRALSFYGNRDIQTPGLDRLAREGMRFEHALTSNSFCTPSRAAILTGKYSHRNGITHLSQKFDGSQQTFPKLLQAAGYQTALVREVASADPADRLRPLLRHEDARDGA